MFDGLLGIFWHQPESGRVPDKSPTTLSYVDFLEYPFWKVKLRKTNPKTTTTHSANHQREEQTAQSPSPFSCQCLKPHLPDAFFQQLPPLNHHALRPESRYISPNCFQSLPLHPCHGPTDVPSAYREQRNIYIYIHEQMCIMCVCVWVCLKIMDFPKMVQEMASFVSNQLDLGVSNF